ncbi:DUF7405 family protein [Halosimplex sp. J119]
MQRDDSGLRLDPDLPRREFLKAALAVGGASAYSACLERPETPEVPSGADVPSELPRRQHEWTPFLLDDEHGNPRFPRHQLLLFLDYAGDSRPTEDEREQVEAALRTAERAFQLGARGQPRHDALVYEGLLFTIGYSPSYFERFDASLPPSIDLPLPQAVLDELGESATADDYDAVMHFAADYPQFILETELALRGELSTLNGVDVKGTFDGILEPVERRSGFMGRGLPEKRLDEPRIPEDASLSMGYKSTFTDTVPTEDSITIQTGSFAGGTTQQVSRLSLDLPSWYDRSESERAHAMFSPHHSPEQVGETGELLAEDSGVDAEIAEQTDEDARTRGCVGHQQKLVKARTDDDAPRIMRRDFNGTGGDGAVLMFDSWQRGIGEFLETAKAMRTDEFGDTTLSDAHNGILDAIETTNRATFLMPPRPLRALPPADPDAPAADRG